MWGFLVLSFCVILGLSLGILAGLLPGIHVNTMIPFLFLVSEYLPLDPLHKSVVIISAAVTQTFHDFLPATIFGAPESETALGVLPAHRMLQMSRGYECLRLAVFGSLGAMLLSLLLVPPMFFFFKTFYPLLSSYMFYILFSVTLLLLASERNPGDVFKAAFVFLISGVYGHIVLNGHLLPENDALFPTFSGLFGLSTLLLSVRDKVVIPPQPLEGRFQIDRKSLLSSVAKGSLAGIFVAMLPGVGASSATVLVKITKKEKSIVEESRGMREFVVSICGVGTANAIYALVALFTIGKPRSGAVVAIRDIMGEISKNDFYLFLSVMLLVSGVSVFTMLYLSRFALKNVFRFDYRKMCMLIIVMLLLFVFAFSGFMGLFVCLVGVSIGVLPPLLGVKRSHCMGVLILPVMIYYY